MKRTPSVYYFVSYYLLAETNLVHQISCLERWNHLHGPRL